MTKGFGVGVFVVALMLGASAAGDDAKDKKRDPEAIFKKLDTNNDKHLSKDEFLKLADYGKDREKAREFLAKAFDNIVPPRSKGMTCEQFKKFLIDVRKKKGDSPRG
jgi:hypothetical protein